MEKRGYTVAVTNNKGGIGKTTMTVNLAVALGDRGLRVLIVDADGQANASLSLGLGREDLKPSLAQVLMPAGDRAARLPIEAVIRKNVTPNVDLVPCHVDLYSFDVDYAATAPTDLDWHGALKEALGTVRSSYDVIFIDCPPAFSLITINALVAADGFIVPVTPNYLSSEGLVTLFEIIEQYKSQMGSTAKELGILINQVDFRTNLHRGVVDQLRLSFTGLVFKSEVRQSIRFQEAAAHGKSVLAYEANSGAAAAYRLLAEEFMERTGFGSSVTTTAFEPVERAAKEATL